MPQAANYVVSVAVVAAGLVSILFATAASAQWTLPVPRVMIYPGDTISDVLIEERTFPAGHAPIDVWHTDRRRLAGMIARRSLLPGQAIPLTATKSPDVVRSGRSVDVVFRSGKLSITGRGVAMQNGKPGDAISVQAQDNGAILRGTVAADGSVSLGD
jgi:flagella basal body P-ring formation protein FlgA